MSFSCVAPVQPPGHIPCLSQQKTTALQVAFHSRPALENTKAFMTDLLIEAEKAFEAFARLQPHSEDPPIQRVF